VKLNLEVSGYSHIGVALQILFLSALKLTFLQHKSSKLDEMGAM
jgi:hypothetical protein